MENEILELLKQMQSSINELKEGQTRIENGLENKAGSNKRLLALFF